MKANRQERPCISYKTMQTKVLQTISDIKGTVFSYPTVTYSTWDSMKMPHFKNGKNNAHHRRQF